VLESDEFWQIVVAKDQFDLTNLSVAEIVNRIRSSTAQATIRLWTPNVSLYLLKYRHTNAMVDPGKPGFVFYHSRKLNRSVAAIVNTLVHEYIHVVDHFGDGNSVGEFGHGDQSSAGKQNTAPYWIGEQAYRFHSGSDKASSGLSDPHADRGEVDPADVVD
jgi:hypothetical protein